MFVPVDAAVNLLTGVNRDTLAIGDPIIFRMRVTRDADDRVFVPSNEAFPEPFEVRERRKPVIRTLESGHLQETHDVVLAVYQVGDFTIPPITVRYVTARGDSGRLESTPIAVIVKSVKPEGVTDIQDIKPPVEVEAKIPPWAWLALVGGLGVLGVLIWLWMRHRRKPGVAPLPPPIDWEAEVRRVAGLGLIEKENFRRFYSLLSETLRRCLEAKTPVRAVEQTTFEIVRDLRARHFDEETVRKVEAFLSEADMVKFAKFRPGEAAARAALEAASETVRTVVGGAKPFEDAT